MTGTDFLLLATVGVILVFGLDMVYSASYVIAHNDPQYGSDTYFLVQQAIRAGMGVFLLLVFQAVDYHVWRRLTVYFRSDWSSPFSWPYW